MMGRVVFEEVALSTVFRFKSRSVLFTEEQTNLVCVERVEIVDCYQKKIMTKVESKM